jgi:hypothetical protein
LNVILRQGPSVFQRQVDIDVAEDLLVRRNTFFVLDFDFDVFDIIAGLNLQRDSSPWTRTKKFEKRRMKERGESIIKKQTNLRVFERESAWLDCGG